MSEILSIIWNYPNAFNWFIIFIYFLAIIWHLFQGNFVQVWYWASAISITACVTVYLR